MASDRPITQILIAVVIALLVGGTAPWWWKEYFGHSSQTRQTTTTKPDQSSSQNPSETSSPSSDFKDGSRPFYSADFVKWPSQTNEQGSCKPDQGEYIISPTSNVWFGTPYLQITPVPEDFVFDLHFRVPEKNKYAGLWFQFSGSEQQANYISIIFEISEGAVLYSLEKGWIKDNLYANVEQRFAEREHLSAKISSSDWSQDNKITFKREKSNMGLFINDIFVKSFPVSLFTVNQVSLAAASSKWIIRSLEVRVRPSN
jgi:hypothetical protein